MKSDSEFRIWKWVLTALLIASLTVGVGTYLRTVPIEYQEMSASSYPFRIEDGTGAEIFSISDAGNTAVAGTLGVTGASTLSGVVNAAVGTEHIGLMTTLTTDIAFGTLSGAVATIGDGEVWLVYNVFVKTTTSFNCTGDNCTLTVGDDLDVDGFLAAADASIQATFTEATGYPAGFYGIEATSGGAYTLDDGGPFVYAPSGAAQTIDYAIAGTDPAAGAATIYVVYMRIL